MEGKKWLFVRIAVFVCLLSVLFMTASTGLAATIYAASGNGEDTSIFYVESNGNAKITFKQQEGLCHELSYLHIWDGIWGDEEEWGKYHIYITRIGSGVRSYRVEDWDKTTNGSTYELKLDNYGLYEIKVVPYTASEMDKSWTIDTFLSWKELPRWWVDNWSNCYKREPMDSDKITVVYNKRNGYQSEYTEMEDMTITKSQTIYPKSIDGYDCISDPVNVSFDQFNGASPKTVTFTYIRTTVKITNQYVDAKGNSSFKSFTKTYNGGGRSSVPIEPKQDYYCVTPLQYVTYSSDWGADIGEVTYVHIYGLTDERYRRLDERYKEYSQDARQDSSYKPLAAAMMADVPDNSDADYYAFLLKYAKEDPPEIGQSSITRKPGDVNGDGRISMSDITKLIAYYNNPGSVPINKDNADVNGDGKISMSDITKLIAIYK